ncbi:DEAD/DEAH box helicase [Oscillospiraceae bacterium MB08-C2-2]|nr:DEAD/DEAH box helicase [Oscillospiraceae bacterium MB08-C2-2]
MENTIITQFNKFDLSPELMRSLAKMNFQTPSPVQEAAIGPMLGHSDLLVQAPTGTGKTAAFGIPVVENTDPANRNIQTVILCPTRELAAQTTNVIKQLAAFKPGVGILALYGGDPIQRQIVALRRRPQIIVATPGRLMDHMQRRTIRLNHIQCIVLDEADRMLDMGFRDDIGTILQSIPNKRQTVLFSATLSSEIKNIAATHQVDAQYIGIRQNTLTIDKVEQFYSEIRGNAKTPALIHLLGEKKFGLSLIFVATKIMADTLARQLTEAGYPSDAIHGDLRQSQRDKVMRRYRDKKVRVLVATDVAARGIDVSGIDVVVNYDIPSDSDSYVHRIGRTGRANNSGVAYTFIYPRERSKLQGIMASTRATILPTTLEAYSFPVKGNKPLNNKSSKHRASNRSWKRNNTFDRKGA